VTSFCGHSLFRTIPAFIGHSSPLQNVKDQAPKRLAPITPPRLHVKASNNIKLFCAHAVFVDLPIGQISRQAVTLYLLRLDKRAYSRRSVSDDQRRQSGLSAKALRVTAVGPVASAGSALGMHGPRRLSYKQILRRHTLFNFQL
jgi:hypothetical protein